MKLYYYPNSADYWSKIQTLFLTQSLSLEDRYKSLYFLLQRLCKQVTNEETTIFSNLFVRIEFFVEKYELEEDYRCSLQELRLFCEQLNTIKELESAKSRDWPSDLLLVAIAISTFFQEETPAFLGSIVGKYKIVKKSCTTFYKRLRVVVVRKEKDQFWVIDEQNSSLKACCVKCCDSTVSCFSETLKLLWKGAQLNLLNVTVVEGAYLPEYLVLLPDYLINVTNLVACFKEYGAHPLNYILNRFSPIPYSSYLLLGNVANFFLDEWLHHEGKPNYRELLTKAFQLYPLDFTICLEEATEKERTVFLQNLEKQFYVIGDLVTNNWKDKSEEILLEPSFVCEALGIQGRLDFMMTDFSVLVELKSGKAEENYLTGEFIEEKKGHALQVLLYLAMLDFTKGIAPEKVSASLLYSRYGLLVSQSFKKEQLQQLMNLRNRIVSIDYQVQQHCSIAYTGALLNAITPQRLNEKQLSTSFWQRFLKKPILEFNQGLTNLRSHETAYVMALYCFITREVYASQSGDMQLDANHCQTFLWNATLAGKKKAGEIYYDLSIKENKAASLECTLTFQIPNYEADYLPNFRVGDLVLLYERNKEEDKVTSQQVFKGGIVALEKGSLVVRLRNKQRNSSSFPSSSLYAVEHDAMDVTTKQMFRSISYFIQTNQRRRDLLLGIALPRFDSQLIGQIETTTDIVERSLLKSIAAKDYFLLQGPPGTGKTSRVLKKMVAHFIKKETGNLLLMAYTNRAVDEICRAIETITPSLEYIRIGNPNSCDAQFRAKLLENRMKNVSDRKQVNDLLLSSRVFVGTVVSITSKVSLFRKKSFDLAIIDEATQIVEPQLLGLLCMLDKKGEDLIQRFVMIGDQKQLPAVILQHESKELMAHPLLEKIGVSSFHSSLFERLYYCNQQHHHFLAIDMLCKQGRMHPDIAAFVNEHFYQCKLDVVPLEHQKEKLNLRYHETDLLQHYLATHRIGFIPSLPNCSICSFKKNEDEATIIVQMVEKIYDLYQWNDLVFDPSTTLGIIAPYRNQIALINQKLKDLNNPIFDRITVDTVERYQGGQKDIILYSFCVNEPFQLNNLIQNMEEDGVVIDRKLNVAITRARKQLFLTGVPDILSKNRNFKLLIDSIELCPVNRNFSRKI